MTSTDTLTWTIISQKADITLLAARTLITVEQSDMIGTADGEVVTIQEVTDGATVRIVTHFAGGAAIEIESHMCVATAAVAITTIIAKSPTTADANPGAAGIGMADAEMTDPATAAQFLGMVLASHVLDHFTVTAITSMAVGTATVAAAAAAVTIPPPMTLPTPTILSHRPPPPNAFPGTATPTVSPSPIPHATPPVGASASYLPPLCHDVVDTEPVLFPDRDAYEGRRRRMQRRTRDGRRWEREVRHEEDDSDESTVGSAYDDDDDYYGSEDGGSSRDRSIGRGGRRERRGNRVYSDD